MLLGVFYREFTKINGFTEQTVLGGLHTHILVSGVFFFLIVLLLEKSFELTKDKKFNKFFITYNIGLLLSVIMMAIRGCVEVLNLEISTMVDSSISGIVSNPDQIEPPFRLERASVPEFESHPSGFWEPPE